MDATPRNPGLEGPYDDGLALLPERDDAAPNGADALGRKWSALHRAAAVVGGIAGLGAAATPPEADAFPAVIGQAGGWRRDLARQGIEDLTAIMEPGLSALLAAHARGVNPAAAALALWREFVAARDALLTLAPPPAS